ncbi:MAG TPA: dockerin type I repeat-containing protein, partial [Anaerolineales bacterium]
SFKWLDIVSGTVVTQADVSLQAGNQSWTSPSGMGSEVAVYLQRTGPLSTLPGDLNLDGQVDVVDVQLGANAVLGLETDPGILDRADVNDDGQLDILDVQSIVNLVLLG